MSLIEPTSAPDNAIGFNPAKQILKTVYEAIRRGSQTYSEIHGRLNALHGIRIPLNVLIGRQNGSTDDEARLRQLNLPTDREIRKSLFGINDRVIINSAVVLFFECSQLQCFIKLTDGVYLLNHLSMPAEKGDGEIHFKEDIASQGNYYEFVPFTDPSSRPETTKKQFPELPGISTSTPTTATPSPAKSPFSVAPKLNVETIAEKLGATASSSKGQGTKRLVQMFKEKAKAKKSEETKQGGKRRSTRRRRALRKTRKAYI